LKAFSCQGNSGYEMILPKISVSTLKFQILSTKSEINLCLVGLLNNLVREYQLIFFEIMHNKIQENMVAGVQNRFLTDTA
jgi:hypothetical protein